MKIKESWGVNVCPAIGHLTVLFFFWVSGFVGLTLILGKITREKLLKHYIREVLKGKGSMLGDFENFLVKQNRSLSLLS